MITVTQALQDLAAIEKKRKAKIKLEVERDAGDTEPLTAAHAIAEGEAAEAARKTIADRGATDPGAGIMPPHDMPDAGAYNRPYLETGTAAPSPQQGAPNVAPLPPQHPGILQPLPQSPVPTVVGSGPVVAGLAQHAARAAQSKPPMPPARGQ